MERDGVVDAIAVTDNGPQLHSNLGRQGYEVFSDVSDLLLGQSLSENLAGLHLLNHSSVVIDAPLCGLVDRAIIDDLLDSDLPLVLLNEVAESDGTLKANERSRKVEEEVTVAVLTENTGRSNGIVEPLPATTGRVDLVGLKVANVLKVLTVLVDEIPEDTINIVLRPLEPVLG